MNYKLIGCFTYLLFFVLLSVGVEQVNAQVPEGLERTDDLGRGGNNGLKFPADSTKQRKKGGKILDDSTKLVYGAYTTQYFKESDWFYNTNRTRNVDTLFLNLHRYKYEEQADWELQTLGNLATASRLFFYQPPNEIGNRLGVRAFDHLLITSEQVNYYDTKSPHSRWQYVQGGEGRTFLDAELTQNINPRVNAGMLYRRVTNRRLLGVDKINSNDRHSDFQNILMQASVRSADGRYKVLGYANFGKVVLSETGGLVVGPGVDDLRSLYEAERKDLDNELEDSDGFFRQNTAHLYQQFSLVDSTDFQLYHELNWTFNENSYESLSPDTNSYVYPVNFFSDEQTGHRVRYDEIDNRVGVKFRKSKVFLASYFRRKTFGYSHSYLPGSSVARSVAQQSFVGVVGNYFVNDSVRLDFEGEHLLFDDYRLAASLQTKLFEVYAKRSFAQPSLMAQYYFGNHFIWRNSFQNELSDQVGGRLKLRLKKFAIEPFAQFTRLENYVYYNQEAVPEQSESAISQVQLGFTAQGRFRKHWHYSGKLTYTKNDQESRLPVPEFVALAQLSYQRKFFDGAFPAQIGLDAHYHSSYFAPQYQPVTQQFFLQDRFQIGNYPVLDFFMNGQVKRATIFVKFTNLLQLAFGEGYFDTVGYMSQPTQFEFGFRWMFYD